MRLVNALVSVADILREKGERRDMILESLESTEGMSEMEMFGGYSGDVFDDLRRKIAEEDEEEDGVTYPDDE